MALALPCAGAASFSVNVTVCDSSTLFLSLNLAVLFISSVLSSMLAIDDSCDRHVVLGYLFRELSVEGDGYVRGGLYGSVTLGDRERPRIVFERGVYRGDVVVRSRTNGELDFVGAHIPRLGNLGFGTVFVLFEVLGRKRWGSRIVIIAVLIYL